MTTAKSINEWRTYWDAKEGDNPIALNDYCIDGKPMEWDRYHDVIVRPNVARLEIDETCDVLEIGCGTGLHLKEMEGRVRRLVGTDLSITMLSHYRGSAARCVCQADLQPFPRGTFNRILMIGVSMHFPDFPYFRKVVEHCLELVRSGGMVLIGDIQFGNRASRSGYMTYSKTEVVDYLDSLGAPYSLLAQNRLKRAINNRHDLLIYREDRATATGVTERA